MPSLQLFVGVTQLFGPSCHVKLVGTNPNGTTRNGYIIFGVRNASGTDPVAPIGTSGGYTITSPSIVPFQVTFLPGETEHTARWRLDVPSEPLLENVVVLFQVAVEDGANGLAYTSVRGSSILPAWVNPRLRYAGSGARRSQGQPSQGFTSLPRYLAFEGEQRDATRRAEVLRAARAWAGLDENGNTRAAHQAVVERLRGMMQR